MCEQQPTKQIRRAADARAAIEEPGESERHCERCLSQLAKRRQQFCSQRFPVLQRELRSDVQKPEVHHLADRQNTCRHRTGFAGCSGSAERQPTDWPNERRDLRSIAVQRIQADQYKQGDSAERLHSEASEKPDRQRRSSPQSKRRDYLELQLPDQLGFFAVDQQFGERGGRGGDRTAPEPTEQQGDRSENADQIVT